MAFKAILFVILLCLGCMLSMFYHPMVGLITYLINYSISPSQEWWGRQLAQMGIRYAQFPAIAIAVGMLLHRSKLYFNERISVQEFLFIVFILWIWFTHFVGLSPGEITDRNAMKMLKILIFILMLSHLVTTVKRYETTIWVMIFIGLYLAYNACYAPISSFKDGRLNISIGGPDFREGNFLGTHLSMLLPFIAVMFFRTKHVFLKLLCFFSAILIVNALILIRSRGVFLGCATGLIVFNVYAFFYLRAYRKKIFFSSLIFVTIALSLTDTNFWQRMQSLKVENVQSLDRSAQVRLLAWKAAIEMVKEYPLGIGEGNFKEYVGFFDPRIPGRDTHNTWLRCLAELGYPGLFIFLLLLFFSFYHIYYVWKRSSLCGFIIYQMHSFALFIAMIIVLVSAFFCTCTYIEYFYHLMFFPLCLKRSFNNEFSAG